MMMPLIPERMFWHITFGTYGSRLHGSDALNVDRHHNQPELGFVPSDPARHTHVRNLMRAQAVRLTRPVRLTIETGMMQICQRGGWKLHACAAPPEPENDHVHLLIDANPAAAPKAIRQLIKRWLTQHLDKHHPRPAAGTWWAKGGSTRPVKDIEYLQNVIAYINQQRTGEVED